MKNILVLQGGGRPKGNTAQLVEHFIKGAEEAGNNVELISLLKSEVKGCLGCNACRYGKPCIQKDSFNEIVPKIKNADCIMEICITGYCIRLRHKTKFDKDSIIYNEAI